MMIVVIHRAASLYELLPDQGVGTHFKTWSTDFSKVPCARKVHKLCCVTRKRACNEQARNHVGWLHTSGVISFAVTLRLVGRQQKSGDKGVNKQK